MFFFFLFLLFIYSYQQATEFDNVQNVVIPSKVMHTSITSIPWTGIVGEYYDTTIVLVVCNDYIYHLIW
jgi:hypothetical protein